MLLDANVCLFVGLFVVSSRQWSIQKGPTQEKEKGEKGKLLGGCVSKTELYYGSCL